ncbi:MAG: TlpA disulfide reductase family protein [Candidatus Acidiferrales bacterium]
MKLADAILAAGILCAGIAAASATVARTRGNGASAAAVISGRNQGAASAQKVESLPLIDLTGYKRLVAKYKGKPVLVNFWATWCEPCRTEYPMLVGLAKEYQSKGVVFLGVSYDQQQDLTAEEEFLAMYRPVFLNYRQKPGIDAAAFNHGVDQLWNGELPSTIFYRRNGTLLVQFYGRRPRAEFEKAIQQILRDPFLTSSSQQ